MEPQSTQSSQRREFTTEHTEPTEKDFKESSFVLSVGSVVYYTLCVLCGFKIKSIKTLLLHRSRARDCE